MRPLIFASALVAAVLASAPAAQDPATEVAADEQTLKALTIGTDGPALVEFFRERMRTEADRNLVHRLIAELGDDDFATREAARGAILRIGPRLLDPLESARNPRNAEAAGRIGDCIRVLGNDVRDRQSASSTALVMAAARLLAIRKPAGAAQVLLDYLVTADQEVAEEILRILPALATTNGKADPALVKALTAREPVRRACAGVVLARADIADQRDAVRKLLLDPDLDVRMRVGLALANAKDREAISPLIELLGKLPPQDAWQITDLLERLAGEKAPQAPPGTDDAGRVACRDAWAAWWREHGAAVNMAAVDDPRPQLGYTLFVLPDQGRVLEIDRAHKVRWEIRLLRSPRSVQLLPRDRVLIAEGGGEITERNLKGDIQWRREVIDAVCCQRLPNGNTFVVTKRGIFEFDGAGRKQTLYSNGSTLLTARKLPSGHIIAIDNNVGYLKLDAAGREISHFAVGLVSNNCLDVLPNGNVVVANFRDGKVKEYNPRGTVVWQIDFPSPFSAQRLPNGNTLLACHEPARVVEVNRAGKIVWEHRLESPNHRPWFASRR